MSKAQDKFQKMMADFKKSGEYKRLQAWDKFYELNPSFCPHNGLVAPVDEAGEDLPGVCLTCGAEDILEQGEIPNGYPFTITYSSDAHTITTEASFATNQR